MSGARIVREKDWYSNSYSKAPVAIAELGIPGEQMPAAPTTFDSGCRADLLTVDGRPVPLRVTGSTADAVARKLLTVTSCGGPVTLSTGDHVLRHRHRAEPGHRHRPARPGLRSRAARRCR